MLQPDDTHSHGHVAGHRVIPPTSLIMTGDNQRVFRRTEWDTPTGRSRTLEPGDGGRWIDSEPFPVAEAPQAARTASRRPRVRYLERVRATASTRGISTTCAEMNQTCSSCRRSTSPISRSLVP